MAKRRPSGDGMVRRREDGRWEGRIVVGHKENGNPIFRTIFAAMLNVYAHTNKEMQQAAARKIDHHIAKSKTRQFVMPAKTPRTTFQAQKGKIRKPGTGCVSRLGEHLWKGRYTPIWPDGKRHARNVYAKTEAECETLLAELIRKTKAEIAEERVG